MAVTSPDVAARWVVLDIAMWVDDLHPEIGDARAQVWWAAAVESLAHALVDLADGPATAPAHARPTPTGPAQRHDLAAAGPDQRADPASAGPVPSAAARASCSAAAADLRRAAALVEGAIPALPHHDPVLAGLVCQALMRLSQALQRWVQDAPGGASSAALQALLRSLKGTGAGLTDREVTVAP